MIDAASAVPYAQSPSGIVITVLVTILLAFTLYSARTFGTVLTKMAERLDKFDDKLQEIREKDLGDLRTRLSIIDDRALRNDADSRRRDVSAGRGTSHSVTNPRRER